MGEDVEIKNIDNWNSKRKNISQKTSSSSTTSTNIETTMETNKRTPSRLAKVQEEVLFSANNFNLSLPFISNYPLVTPAWLLTKLVKLSGGKSYHQVSIHFVWIRTSCNYHVLITFGSLQPSHISIQQVQASAISTDMHPNANGHAALEEWKISHCSGVAHFVKNVHFILWCWMELDATIKLSNGEEACFIVDLLTD